MKLNSTKMMMDQMMMHDDGMQVSPTENGDQNPATESLIQELEYERRTLSMNNKGCKHAIRLIQEELDRLQGKQKDTPKYLEVVKDKPTKVCVKVLVPNKEHPKFNFVGKLLGPMGNSLKRLQEETMTRMAVLGRGSIRDRNKEEELRNGGDPKYVHLNDDLHVDISALAPPAEAYARISYALVEIRKYLIPDNNDDIAQGQMREMQMMSGLSAENGPPPPPPPPPRGRGALRGGPGSRGVRGGHPGMMGRGLPRPPPPPPPPQPVPPPPSAASLPKQRVMSILDKARQSLEGTQQYAEVGSAYGGYESYGYGYGQEAYPPPAGRGFKTPPLERSRYRPTPY